MLKKIIKIAAAVFSVTALYAAFENAFCFSTRHEGECGKLRVLQISDIHKKNSPRTFGKIIRAAQTEDPDIIILTGDMVSRTETDFSAIESLFRSLCAIAPVYMCMGNHEQSLPAGMQKKFMAAVSRTDVKLLTNSHVRFSAKGEDYDIYAIMPDYTTYKKNGGYRHLDELTISDIRRYIGNAEGENVLLLAHNPIPAEVYAEWGADYTFCGHIHGGSVRLFGTGILSPERRFFPKYSMGIYNIPRSGKSAPMKLCVSSGIGKLRLFNSSEVVLYLI